MITLNWLVPRPCASPTARRNRRLQRPRRLELAPDPASGALGQSLQFRRASLGSHADPLAPRRYPDDPNGDNFIYAYNKCSGIAEVRKKIESPVYYNTVDKNGFIYITTTIEDRKRHRAIIYISTDCGKNWQEHYESEKDLWPINYFGNGVVEFVNGQENFDKLNLKLIGLK